MRTTYISILLALFISYTSNAFCQKNSMDWVQDLKDFKSAVAAGHKSKVKSFIELPLVSDNNNIWQVIFEGNEKELENLPEQPKPFTAQDFEKYYNKLFTKKFTACLAKLNADELNKKGETETTKFKEGDLTYSINATVDKTEKTVTLGLSYSKFVKDKKGRIEDAEEYGTLYIFSIANGKLIFKEIRFSA